MNNEDNYKIELLIGKVQRVDCNKIIQSGVLKRETAQGWGYDFYVLDNISEPASTLMACVNTEKRDTFVPLNLRNDLIRNETSDSVAWLRYNSKLPIVVYVPKNQGFHVIYRVWRAEEMKVGNRAKAE